MNRHLASVLACALVVFVAGSALAEESKGSFEISEFISFTKFAEEVDLDSNPGFGVRVGHNFNTWLGMEFTFHRSANATLDIFDRPTVDVEEVQAVAMLHWKRTGKKTMTRLQPYIAMGVGYQDYSPSAGIDEKKAARFTKNQGGKGIKYQVEAARVDSTATYVAALGAKWYFTEVVALRLDLRTTSAISADFTNFEPSLGLSFLLGGTPGKDEDGDNVIDFMDDCPGTPRGATVDHRGCPGDDDGDGVYNGIDVCPGTPSGVQVDDVGCPKDSDADGVYDGPDKCPDTPAGAKVDTQGCPVDSDGDGVPDGIDECPDTPKGALADAKGCPKDGDGDGVPDGIDQCPKTPKDVPVDARGCALDSDGDGVPDGVDECPGTPSGMKVDKKGCPAVKPLFEAEQKSVVLKGVNFDTNKDTLKPESIVILDEVAASLAAYGTIRVEVQGHCDSTGANEHNRVLSEARAKAVVDYIVSKGIDSSRLVAAGYGESRPIATNDTAAGRAENRRVELVRLGD